MKTLPKSMFPSLFVALALGLSAPASAQSITDSAWVPVEIAGAAVDAGQDVLIRFETNGTVFGNGGCNNFNGSYVTNGDAILIGPIAATMMLCEDPLSATEFQIFQGLEATRTFSVDDATLMLANVEGTVVLSLVPRAME